MVTFKAEIVEQISEIPDGKIFTFSDLSFPLEKTANVAVILSDLSKESKLARIEKGAYYKPKKSSLGLGILPVFQEEQIAYLTRKLNGYLTGNYIYNKMSLTEQVSQTITIASHVPVRPFTFNKLSIECVKAYVDNIPNNDAELHLIRILDAIKDIKQIPAIHPHEAYHRIFSYHISHLSQPELDKIVSLSILYPPRVRKILGDMMEQNNNLGLRKYLVNTISPTTRFDLSYKIV
jgi:hypothetical protein